jgi:hypothetical protein
LREIPKFSGLSSEDLEKIAEVAEEFLYFSVAIAVLRNMSSRVREMNEMVRAAN